MTGQGKNIPGSSQMWFVRGRSIKMFPTARCHGTVKNTSFRYTVLCERRKRSSLCQLSEASVAALYVITTKVPQSTGVVGQEKALQCSEDWPGQVCTGCCAHLTVAHGAHSPMSSHSVAASLWLKGSRELEAEDSHIVQSTVSILRSMLIQAWPGRVSVLFLISLGHSRVLCSQWAKEQNSCWKFLPSCNCNI